MLEARRSAWAAALVMAGAVAVAAPASARTLPDLRADWLSAPASVTAGARFDVTGRVTNAAGARVKRSRTAYYLSRDARRGPGDRWLGRGSLRSLAPWAGAVRRRTLAMPQDAGGRYRLIACADAPHRVRESRESDNCVASPRSVAVFGSGIPPGRVPGGQPEPTPHPSPTPHPDPHPDPAPAAPPRTLLAAGDIAGCDSKADEATAELLTDRPGADVATLGDNVYGGSSRAGFDRCYDPSWGRVRGRTHPATGNHEYEDPGAAGYFSYFGSAAGPRGKGWYSYDLGAWHLVVLNSNCSSVGGCYDGSEQERWLKHDLAANPARCTLAYWHDPLFTSDAFTGRATNTAAMWSDLFEAGAEIVLNGHAHEYERFAPQRPSGAAAPDKGIREFVVGTGGRALSSFASDPAPNSERRNNTTFGVLSLTLADGSYDWKFIPARAGGFTDSGSGSCH